MQGLEFTPDILMGPYGVSALGLISTTVLWRYHAGQFSNIEKALLVCQEDHKGCTKTVNELTEKVGELKGKLSILERQPQAAT